MTSTDETGQTSSQFTTLLGGFRGTRVWVIGDLMLDEYVDGEVRRISPEAPVPVVAVEQTYVRLGGAARFSLSAARRAGPHGPAGGRLLGRLHLRQLDRGRRR